MRINILFNMKNKSIKDLERVIILKRAIIFVKICVVLAFINLIFLIYEVINKYESKNW